MSIKPGRACPDCGRAFPRKGSPLHDPCTKYGPEAVSRRLQLIWPPTREYFTATVRAYDQSTGCHEVLYDTNELEWAHLGAERRQVRWLDPEPPEYYMDPSASDTSARKLRRTGLERGGAPRMLAPTTDRGSVSAQGPSPGTILLRVYRDVVSEPLCIGAVLVGNDHTIAHLKMALKDDFGVVGPTRVLRVGTCDAPADDDAMLLAPHLRQGAVAVIECSAVVQDRDPPEAPATAGPARGLAPAPGSLLQTRLVAIAHALPFSPGNARDVRVLGTHDIAQSPGPEETRHLLAGLRAVCVRDGLCLMVARQPAHLSIFPPAHLKRLAEIANVPVPPPLAADGTPVDGASHQPGILSQYGKVACAQVLEMLLESTPPVDPASLAAPSGAYGRGAGGNSHLHVSPAPRAQMT